MENHPLDTSWRGNDSEMCVIMEKNRKIILIEFLLENFNY